MRKSLLTVATAGLLALTSVSGVFAQPVPTIAAAESAAIAACTNGTPAACGAAMQVLTAAVRAANPNAPLATINTLVLAEFSTVVASVRAAGGPVANIAAIDAAFAASVPGVAQVPSVVAPATPTGAGTAAPAAGAPAAAPDSLSTSPSENDTEASPS
jgi:hypothetical protein